MIEKLLGLPELASAHGGEIDQLLFLVHILMLVLFVGWGAFFLFSLWRFSRARNPKADYVGVKSHTSSYLEVAVAVVEIVLLVGFSIPFWAQKVNAFPVDKNPIIVRITAEQFAWNIHYPGSDGKFGKTSMKYFDKQSNPLGLDPNDPDGKDDVVTTNQLHLPVNRPVIIHLTTKDVIHSFALPVMRVKQDAIPGMDIPLWFTPVKTGKFEIACAQLCGIGHYRMKGYLIIDTPEDYKKWLDEQSSKAQAAPSDSFWN